MHVRIISLLIISFLFISLGYAKPGQQEIIAGLWKYAATFDTIKPATFYYHRTYHHPALSAKDAVARSMDLFNRNESGPGISEKVFLELINGNIEHGMSEDTQHYINRISIGKDYLRDTHFKPNGRLIFENRIEGDTLTTLDPGMPARPGSSNPRVITPDQRWIICDLFEWRRALDIIEDATVTFSETENERACIHILHTWTKQDPRGERQRREEYEIEPVKIDDLYVPAVFRTIYESNSQSLIYKDHAARNGLVLPTSIEEERKFDTPPSGFFRPSDMSYKILPENYELGDALER